MLRSKNLVRGFNSMINFFNLEKEIVKRISSAGLTTDELLIYSKVLKSIENNLIITVENFSNLPSTPVTNYIYYVVSDQLVYVYNASVGLWLSLTSTTSNTASAWGNNQYGQIGDNSIVLKGVPTTVVGGLSNWCKISAGKHHTAGIRTDGTIWTWGGNACGQLGDGTAGSTARSSPVSVFGGFTNWCNVSVGELSTHAIKTDGTIWGWGINSGGQLGAGNGYARSIPVQTIGGFTDWCDVSSGCCNTVAIRTDGTIWAWGLNTCGKLGDGTIANRSSPVSVVGGFTNWCRISAGSGHTLGLRTDGSLWAWGLNSSGQLGDNTILPKSSPVSVIGGIANWLDISAGGAHNAAIRSDGTLWTWGQNSCGQLGTASVVARSSPVSVVGGFTDWCDVSAGFCHTAAVRANGTLWTWGNNVCARLGDGTLVAKTSPVQEYCKFADWCQVSAGCLHTAAIRSRSL